MAEPQRSKLICGMPDLDIAIFMSCNVGRPFAGVSNSRNGLVGCPFWILLIALRPLSKSW